jgi:hypothetical protein
MTVLSILKVIKSRNYLDIIYIISSSIYFILFSELVEVKLGRNKMAIFFLIYAALAISVMRVTTNMRNMYDISIHHLTRGCASAMLCYLARAGSSPNKVFLSEGIIIGKNFRWNGMEIEFSQLAIANVLYQMGSGDYVGLVGSLTGDLSV